MDDNSNRLMKMCQPRLNDGTMEQTVAESKSCCYSNRFCISACVKLVLSLLLTLIFTYILLLFFMFGRPQVTYPVVALSIAILLVVTDIIFLLVTILTVCMKDQGLMKIYYMFSIVNLISIAVLCCIAFYIFLSSLSLMFIVFSITLLILMIQMCLSHIMKNAVLMQENNAQHI